MRSTTNNTVLERNYISKWRFLIKEYELVKQRQHARYRFVADFYKAHNTNRQTFFKYYHRFLNEPFDTSLLPQKRGPRWKTRRPHPLIERRVLEQRELGNNRYEIHAILKPKLEKYTPSPSGVYNILKRNGVNKRTKKMKETKRSIIKKKPGEMGHIDCHYLPQYLIPGIKKLFLVGVIDDYSRVAWVEVITSITALSVMFATMKTLSFFKDVHNITFEEIFSDNGSEFKGNNETHPFERLLKEVNIKHRYTRPMRPQTNEKIERFWKTLEEDLISETTFETLEEFNDELHQYLYYYNHERLHSSLNQVPPVVFLNKSVNEICN